MPASCRARQRASWFMSWVLSWSCPGYPFKNATSSAETRSRRLVVHEPARRVRGSARRARSVPSAPGPRTGTDRDSGRACPRAPASARGRVRWRACPACRRGAARDSSHGRPSAPGRRQVALWRAISRASKAPRRDGSATARAPAARSRRRRAGAQAATAPGRPPRTTSAAPASSTGWRAQRRRVRRVEDRDAVHPLGMARRERPGDDLHRSRAPRRARVARPAARSAPRCPTRAVPSCTPPGSAAGPEVVAAQVGCDDAKAGRGERRHLRAPGAPVLREAMQQHDERAGAPLDVVQADAVVERGPRVAAGAVGRAQRGIVGEKSGSRMCGLACTLAATPASRQPMRHPMSTRSPSMRAMLAIATAVHVAAAVLPHASTPALPRSSPRPARADTPRARALLAPARVWDGVADRPHDGWVVLVRGERIAAAGPAPGRSGRPDADAASSCPARTLMPGLIDGHSHLLLHPYNETSWDDQVLREPLALRVARADEPRARHAAGRLHHGARPRHRGRRLRRRRAQAGDRRRASSRARA